MFFSDFNSIGNPCGGDHVAASPALWKNFFPTVLSTLRPISKWPFLSDVLEKAVATVCRKGFTLVLSHRTAQEQKLLLSDLNWTWGARLFLWFLDLSAACDAVNREMLLSRLTQIVSIKGAVLDWFTSDLTARTFTVHGGERLLVQFPLLVGCLMALFWAQCAFHDIFVSGFILRKSSISSCCFADLYGLSFW